MLIPGDVGLADRIAGIERQLRSMNGASRSANSGVTNGQLIAFDDAGVERARFGKLVDGSYGMSGRIVTDNITIVNNLDPLNPISVMTIDPATGAVVITGGTIQSSLPGSGLPRSVIDMAGMHFTNAGGSSMVNIDTTSGDTQIGGRLTVSGVGYARTVLDGKIWDGGWAGIRFYNSTTDAGMPEVKGAPDGTLFLSSGENVISTSGHMELEMRKTGINFGRVWGASGDAFPKIVTTVAAGSTLTGWRLMSGIYDGVNTAHYYSKLELSPAEDNSSNNFQRWDGAKWQGVAVYNYGTIIDGQTVAIYGGTPTFAPPTSDNSVYLGSPTKVALQTWDGTAMTERFRVAPTQVVVTTSAFYVTDGGTQRLRILPTEVVFTAANIYFLNGGVQSVFKNNGTTSFLTDNTSGIDTVITFNSSGTTLGKSYTSVCKYIVSYDRIVSMSITVTIAAGAVAGNAVAANAWPGAIVPLSGAGVTVIGSWQGSSGTGVASANGALGQVAFFTVPAAAGTTTLNASFTWITAKV